MTREGMADRGGRNPGLDTSQTAADDLRAFAWQVPL